MTFKPALGAQSLLLLPPGCTTSSCAPHRLTVVAPTGLNLPQTGKRLEDSILSQTLFSKGLKSLLRGKDKVWQPMSYSRLRPSPAPSPLLPKLQSTPKELPFSWSRMSSLQGLKDPYVQQAAAFSAPLLRAKGDVSWNKAIGFWQTLNS